MRESEDRPHRRLAVVAEAFLDRTLPELLDWLTEAAPEVSAVELGTGGYAPHPHCDRAPAAAQPGPRAGLGPGARQGVGFTIAALNAWGNPLHPDPRIAARHDRDLRETIRLAAQLGVDRVVALAGCPAARPAIATPHFAAGGWLPVPGGHLRGPVGTARRPVLERAQRVRPHRRTRTLRVCLELHPGTAVYNVETFYRLAALGDNLAANIDPEPLLLAADGHPGGHAHAQRSGRPRARQGRRLQSEVLGHRRACSTTAGRVPPPRFRGSSPASATATTRPGGRASSL